MKKVLTLLALTLLVSCGITGQTARQNSAEQQRLDPAIQKMLDQRSYQIDINYMIPLRGASKAVSTYSLTVDGDILDSHLPYAGNAYSLPYGGGKGLTFKEKISSYTDGGWDKDKRTIGITVKNEEDTYEYALEIFTNGVVSVVVSSRNRDNICYRGTLNTAYKK